MKKLNLFGVEKKVVLITGVAGQLGAEYARTFLQHGALVAGLDLRKSPRCEKLQQDYMEFQEKANKGLLSENQIATEQEKFAVRKDELDQLQLKSEALGEKIQARTEEARKNLEWYARYELGKKIYKHLKNNDDCYFSAEL